VALSAEGESFPATGPVMLVTPVLRKSCAVAFLILRASTTRDMARDRAWRVIGPLPRGDGKA